MKLSIITPTYKRAELLRRAVNSVLAQTYTDWELIIINDSPDGTEYASFEKTIADPRITYLKNERNMGVNFSRNRALENISKDSNWVIFLDDDDYLASDALTTFHELITTHPNEKWFVTNRAYKDGRSLTSAPRNDAHYSYALDYLIFKRVKGDATHCINTRLINNIRFSKTIKQAEEWLFFYQVGLKSEIFYHSHNSTLTDGYDTTGGLNFRERGRAKQFRTFITIIHEGWNFRIFYRPTFVLYLLMRLMRITVKL